jgi:phage terminase small subunit
MTETLTPKQQRFIDAYASNDGNGTQAYRTAGYTVGTDTVARVGATRLLALPHISAALARKHGNIQARTEVTSDKLVTAAWRIYEGACEDKAWSAATQAVVTLGRLTGLLIDQRRVTVDDSRGGLRETLSAMTFAQVQAIREDLIAARALPALDTASVIDVEVVDAGDGERARPPA